MATNKVLTVRGYSVLKSTISEQQKNLIRKELTATPLVPDAYAGASQSFKVWSESAERFYLPRAWGDTIFGPPESNSIPCGDPLPKSLVFQGALRPHQEEALQCFRESKHNGIICLPCGYGKTFTGIAAAKEIRNNMFNTRIAN